MGRHQGLRRTVISAVLMLLLAVTIAALPQSLTHAQSKSASINSLNTDKTSYYPGEPMTITLVVHNNGDSAIQILCNMSILNSGSTQVYSYSRKYDLSSGSTSSCQFYWNVPQNLPAGSYQVQSTVADGNDGRFYSSRSASFILNSPSQSPRSAALLELSVDKNSYLPGESSAITVFMQNTGGSDMSLLTAVDVVNPSGIQVYSGVKENRIARGYTDKVSFTLPIPDNATAGSYQIQATIADKTDGTLYGAKSTTVYVQPTANASIVSNNSASSKGWQFPNLGFSAWGQYLITGLLIALAGIVIFILIRNRPRPKQAIDDMELPDITPTEENPEDPLP